jgi:hypothetical protein
MWVVTVGEGPGGKIGRVSQALRRFPLYLKSAGQPAEKTLMFLC